MAAERIAEHLNRQARAFHGLVFGRFSPMCIKVGGSGQSWIFRAAIHSWSALRTEQGMSYLRCRKFSAILDHQPVPENSFRGDRRTEQTLDARAVESAQASKRPARRHRDGNIFQFGASFGRWEEVRCIGPPPAVHSRPLPAA
eukprot:3809271-Prymnesium_polylepis.1